MSVLLKIFALLITGLVLIAIVAGMIFFGAGVIYINKNTTAIQDPTQYSTIIKTYEKNKSPLVNHFPKEIPENAKNVRLYYLPGFLQGSNILQLQMQLPPDEIQQIQERVQPKAVRQYVPGGDNNSPLEETSPDGSFRVTYEYSLYTSASSDGTPAASFPDDYALYVLHDSRGAPDFDWNHPELNGVAINKAASEVVYWMEDY